MADYLQRPASGTALSPGSGQRNPAQQPLSCTLCRQRKIKCDKKLPCSPCSRSNLNCVFPERARHPKKKSTSSKATNDELMRRLGRMEELIEKIKVEGKDVNGKKLVEEGSMSPDTSRSRHTSEAQSPGSNGPDHPEDGMGRYLGSHFWRSLSTEVQGLKETMDDDTDEEDSQLSGQSPAETNTSQSSVLFGSSPLHQRELRLLHPPPAQLIALFHYFQRNIDPMAKILHIPSLRKLVMSASANIDAIPSANYVEALLFAMYYAAITSLTQEECLQNFHDGRNSLLARYRSGTESALSNADLLSTKEIGTLQALVIFLITVRSNDDTMFAWTLFSVAVRLGHSLTLHRESTWSGISPFTREIRRRLWWALVDLDIRGLEDRGTDPFILQQSFNTLKPLNINDDDMIPGSMEPIVERDEFTEMTKAGVSFTVWEYAMRLGYKPPGREDPENTPTISPVEARLKMIQELETKLEKEVLNHCDLASPIAWVTSVVIRLIGSRLRIAVYHPQLHDMRGLVQQYVSREVVLKTAVENLEYGHLLATEPAAAQWRWYFNTRVQWQALAATLAELCVQDKGQLVERAWKIVEAVFEQWAEHIADSRRGMLWRPIKKLMNKAQAKRAEARMKSMSITSQQSLPQFTIPAYGHFHDPNSSIPTLSPSHESTSGAATGAFPNQALDLDQQLSPDLLNSLNVNEAANAINWAEWDEFMQDFEMADQPPMDVNAMQQDASHYGVWC